MIVSIPDLLIMLGIFVYTQTAGARYAKRLSLKRVILTFMQRNISVIE
jgi:hypothetical protein